MEGGTMASRPIDVSEVNSVAATIALAFAADPVWEPALRRRDGRTDHHEPYWRLFVEGAARFGTVRTIDDGGAVSVWLPPGEAELTDDQAARLATLLRQSLDAPGVEAIETLYRRFDASRAARPPHVYLSLLATHPEQRGRGIGQLLLAQDLDVWDELGSPAYLESTNPANDHRYVRAGFRTDGGFSAVQDDAWISAMWRPAGGQPPDRIS
jgi:GNAT superfamily N-acetyltransferase